MNEASNGVSATKEGLWAVGEHAKPGASPRGHISSLCCSKESAQRIAEYWRWQGMTVDVWPLMVDIAINFDTGFFSITCENAYYSTPSDDFVVGEPEAVKSESR